MAKRVSTTNRKIIKEHGKCAYCGCSPEYIVVDHIFPTSLGGNSELKNLTSSCVRCNSIKHSMPIKEFLFFVSTKRDVVRLKTRRYRVSNYPKDWIIDAIRKNREKHSYYTRIINSITSQKYLLHG